MRRELISQLKYCQTAFRLLKLMNQLFLCVNNILCKQLCYYEI